MARACFFTQAALRLLNIILGRISFRQTSTFMHVPPAQQLCLMQTSPLPQSLVESQPDSHSLGMAQTSRPSAVRKHTQPDSVEHTGMVASPQFHTVLQDSAGRVTLTKGATMVVETTVTVEVTVAAGAVVVTAVAPKQEQAEL